MTVPKFNKLMWPALKALGVLGGSGTNDEIVKKVIELEAYPDSVQNQLHNNGPGTELEYRLAWAKTYLKKAGALENSKNTVWALTEFGRSVTADKIEDVLQLARSRFAETKKQREKLSASTPESPEGIEQDEDLSDWKESLLTILKERVSPSAFERLCQRILRESGFVEVVVTGRSGDGGIDGYGILKMGLLSFKVLFQCKRYKDSVGPSAVRDLHGAMQGRAEKGLLITTGNFTSGSKAEAQRDGAPPIDLIDGNDLCDLLKKLKLGIDTEIETVERIRIQPDWYDRL